VHLHPCVPPCREEYGQPLGVPDADVRVAEIGHQLGHHGGHPQEEDAQPVVAVLETLEELAQRLLPDRN